MGFVMFPRIKFSTNFNHFSYFFNFMLLVYCFTVVCLTKFVTAEEIEQINDCKCRLQNGSIIDLSSLSYKDKPRWQNLKATGKPDNFTYSYNPCSKFNFGSGDGCKNVDVCQSDNEKKLDYNCGDKVFYNWNPVSKTVYLLYTGIQEKTILRRTIVTLICAPDVTTPELEVLGELSPLNYSMTLKTRCACPDLCRENHLSTGSVLVILFLIFVALYLVLGIIHSSLTRGAHGWELIPHHEFWADFPLLVRDGCVFVISGCKADTAYERI